MKTLTKQLKGQELTDYLSKHFPKDSDNQELIEAQLKVQGEGTRSDKEEALINYLYNNECRTLDPDEVEESRYDSNLFEYGSQEYLVYTEDEAEEAWEESLDSYIDDCILPELPDYYKDYFDTEKWKRDARYDGRGACLNHYDGSEYEEQVNGEWFFIYRTN